MRLERAYFSLIFIFITLLFGCESEDEKAKTIEEAFKKTKVSYYEILHKEDLENGKIVFFNSISNIDNKLELGIAFVKGDNKIGWDLIFSDRSNIPNEHMSVNDVFLPETFRTDENHKDIVYGIIYNPEIKEVKVRTRNGSLEDGSFKEARLVQTDWKELYFYIRGEPTRTQIIGFSQDGKEISNQG